MSHNSVPLMYQAQIKDRGMIQYAGNKSAAKQWIEEWFKGCPPIPNKSDEVLPKWKQKPSTIRIPKFGQNVHTWEYTLIWRLVTNSGQDDGIIRPVIGAKGVPYYTGTSMKGAFLRACLEIEPDKVLDYCGGEEKCVGGKTTKPGILRFHGGYPVDMSWANSDRLLDIIHSQQKFQVMYDDIKTKANLQISLYRTTFIFGISEIKYNHSNDLDWELVQRIWEHALSNGIGSRTSAGYGKFKNSQNSQNSETVFLTDNKVVISVGLKGKGINSRLLNQNASSEFRPNMFKATLRGHTLRLLAGLTDEYTVQKISEELWGGITSDIHKKGSTVGKFGVSFKYDVNFKYDIDQEIRYDLEGLLEISNTNSTLAGRCSENERQFLALLIKFSMLLGGFGRSWRRSDHKLFYPAYRKDILIGCHWIFQKSFQLEEYCITVNDGKLNNIKKFLSDLPDTVRGYFPQYIKSGTTGPYVETWRESWHPKNVQVWARIAEGREDSRAIEWFHRDNIKRTDLTGYVDVDSGKRKISQIWHRMYPLYTIQNDKIVHDRKQTKYRYVEILTIFPPDNRDVKADNPGVKGEFFKLLETDNTFEKLWGY